MDKTMISGESNVTEEALGESEPIWSWDDNIPGNGERPDWLKEKYSKVVDQAKAYIEAEKRLGATVAPKDYDLSQYDDYFNLEDNHFLDLKDNARKYNLSQEALNDIINPIIQYQSAQLPNIDEEIAKLGENPQQRLDVVNTWASNTLSQKSLETLGNIATRAEVVELIDEIRQKFDAVQSQSPVPTQMHNLSEQKVETLDDIQNEMTHNAKRYREDSAYRSEISERLRRIYGDD